MPRCRTETLAPLLGCLAPVLAVIVGLCPVGRSADDPDPEVKRLMRVASDPDNSVANRIAAARKIAELGENKGKPAARALCQMAVQMGAVRRPALDALEKVDPKLYPHIVTLIVDNESSNHYKAIGEIAGLGNEARSATPVLMAHAKAMVRLAGRVGDYNNLLLTSTASETMAIPLLVELAAIDKSDKLRDAFLRHGRTVRTDTLYQQEKAALLATADAIALARIAGDETAVVKLIADTIMGSTNNMMRYGAIVALRLSNPKTVLAVQRQVKRAKTDADKAVREEAVEVDKNLQEAAKKKKK